MNGYWKSYFELNGVSLDNATELCKRLSQNAEKAIWYLHPIKDRTGQEMPHVHGLIYNFSKSDDTFRNEVKKTLNVKGSQLGVSNTYERGTKMTEEHIDKYVCYMSKGKFQPIYNKGFDDPWVESRRLEWRAPTSVRITGDLTVITNGSVKRKEITQATMARELSVWILEQKAANVLISKNEIMDKCEGILKANGKPRHWRNVANICQDAMWDWDRDYVRQKIISMI